MIDKAAWDQTVGIALDTKNDTGSTIITTDPPETAYSNEYVEKALQELKDEGVDVDGADFTPLTVELQEGGN
jgi:NitT/TauT family transport system substrate-binding protein